MAIVQNFWLKGAKKKLAGSVIYKAGGQTIQRSLAESVSNPQTRSQMEQRVKWSNMVNFYRANRDWMKYAYESKKANQSEYNKLMSLNVSNSRIYFTKQAAAAGACIVDEYIMTQGSLPSITYNRVGQEVLTNIFLQDGQQLDETSTVAEFSQSVLDANPGIHEGDQISLLRYTQMVNEATGFPYVILRKYEIIMSLTSQDLWVNFLPYELVAFTETSEGTVLSITPTGNAGGLLMVLSRTISGKTYVSTQSILPMDNSALINAYSSASALNAAINSYGESEEAFLSSENANYAENNPIELVPLSVTIGTTDIAAREYAGTLSSWVGKRLAVNFNAPFNETPTAFYIDTHEAGNNGTAQQASVSVEGSKVIVSSVSAGTVDTTNQVRAVRVVVADTTYEISFPYNQAEGGLE